MIEAYLGLGSNLGDRSGFLKSAVEMLGQLDRVSVLSLSSIYRTQPVGPISQENYFNAVVHIETTLNPKELLNVSLRIEKECGRIRGERWGPRTLDIDILTYGDLEIRDDNLSIPHPLMMERAFVLVPLIEISPNIKIGGYSAKKQLSRFGNIDAVEQLIAFDRCETVGIIGASSKPDRYSNRAQKLLTHYGHSVVPVSYRDQAVLGVPCFRSIEDYSGRLETLTLYLSPERQTHIIEELVKAKPNRVIFNPGTESIESQRRFVDAGISTENACTLVMLQTGQFG